MSLSTAPILAAAASNDVAAIRWLVERERARVDQLGDWIAPEGGSTPATTSGGVAPASLERRRRTPLMVAATHGSVDALCYLLSAGADPNLRGDDDEKATALHCAASGGSAMSVDCVAALLRFGADGKALDGFGREPADVFPVTQTTTATGRTSASARGGGVLLHRRAPFAMLARGNPSTSSSGSAGSSPPSGDQSDGSCEPPVGRGSGGSSCGSIGTSSGTARLTSPASLSGSGSAGSFGCGFAFGEPANGANPGNGANGRGRRALAPRPGVSGVSGVSGLPQPGGPGPAPPPSASSPSAEPDLETRMSDDFRMFEFKVRRCLRTRAHDWTECPYAHPGEKARRRDPRRFRYGGTACPEFRKGSCPRGDACEYAHGVFECWLHPSRYRTQLCKDGARCGRRACFFAHAPNQLRPPTDAFGTVVASATIGGLAANEATCGNGNGVDGSVAAGTRHKPSTTGRGASLDLDPAAAAFAFGARAASPFAPGGGARGGGLGHQANAHASRTFASGGSVAPRSDSNDSTGTNHGSISNDSSFAGSGSGSGSERGSGSDDGRAAMRTAAESASLPFGARDPSNPRLLEKELGSFSRQHPPPFGFGAGPGESFETGRASNEFEFSTSHSYGNGISRENGGGGPAVAAVALLGGGGGALGGLHAVNGLDPESGVALPSRRSFDGTLERRAALGPSLLGGMSNLGLRGRHSVDGARAPGAGLEHQFGWGPNPAAGEARGEPTDLEHRSRPADPNEDAGRAPTPSREAMRAWLHGGVAAGAPAPPVGERRPGDAAVPGSKPDRGDKQTLNAPGAPPHIGPRKSSFQHLGMIEGVLGDETFLGA